MTLRPTSMRYGSLNSCSIWESLVVCDLSWLGVMPMVSRSQKGRKSLSEMIESDSINHYLVSSNAHSVSSQNPTKLRRD